VLNHLKKYIKKIEKYSFNLDYKIRLRYKFNFKCRILQPLLSGLGEILNAILKSHFPTKNKKPDAFREQSYQQP